MKKYCEYGIVKPQLPKFDTHVFTKSKGGGSNKRAKNIFLNFVTLTVKN